MNSLVAPTARRLALPRGATLFTCFVALNVAATALTRSSEALDAILVASLAVLLARRPGLALTAPPSGTATWAAFHGFLAWSIIRAAQAPTPQAARHVLGAATALGLFHVFNWLGPELVGRSWPIIAALVAAGSSALLLDGGSTGSNVVSSVAAYHLMIATLLWIASAPGRSWAGVACGGLAAAAGVGLLAGHRTMVALGGLGIVAVASMRLRLRASTQWLILLTALGIIGVLVLANTGSDAAASDALNEASIELTGTTFRSGRQRLWPATLFFIGQAPLFGWGTGTLLSDFVPTTLSAHNSYLQVTLQLGVVGLALLGAVLLTIWRQTLVGRRVPEEHDGLLVFSSVCIVLVIAHAALEVFLTQNQIVVATPAWMLLGMATGCIEAARSQP